MPQKKQAGKRAEIAGRAHIKYFNESNCKLAAEYDIDESTVREIRKEYKDKMQEAIAAAERYYETHQPTQPLASSGKMLANSGNAAPRLQWAPPASNLHATLPPGATNLVGVAAGTMLAALQGPSNHILNEHQFTSMSAYLLCSHPSILIPTQIQVLSSYGQVEAGLRSIQGPPASQSMLACGIQHHGTVADNVAARNQEAHTNCNQGNPTEIEQRIRERVLSQADTTRIINKLRSEGLTSISECKTLPRKLFSRNGWKESDIDVLLLDDVEWKETHWIEPFIRCHLHSFHADQHAQFRKIIQDESIRSESELRIRHSSLRFPLAVTSRLLNLFPDDSPQADARVREHQPGEATIARRSESADSNGQALEDLGEAAMARRSDGQAHENPGEAASARRSEVADSDGGRGQRQGASGELEIQDDDSDLREAEQVLQQAIMQDRNGGNYESHCENPQDAHISNCNPASAVLKAAGLKISLDVHGPCDAEPPLADVAHGATQNELARRQASSNSLVDLFRGLRIQRHGRPTEREINALETIYHGHTLPGDKLRFMQIAGEGSYGVAVKAQRASTSSPIVLKIEFLRPGEESALERELQLYKGKNRANNCPFPQLVPVFAHSNQGRTVHDSIKVLLGDINSMTILTMAIEYLDDWPQQQLKKASLLYSQEKRVDDTTHALVLQIMDSLLFLQVNFIAHLDMKVSHLFIRVNGCIVWIDFGLFRYLNREYSTGRQPAKRKRIDSLSPLPKPVISFPVQQSGIPNVPPRVLGEGEPGRPGTMVYRVPFPAKTSAELSKADIYAFGIILLGIVWPWQSEVHYVSGKRNGVWTKMERYIHELAQRSITSFEAELISKLDKANTAVASSRVKGSACARRANTVFSQNQPKPQRGKPVDDAHGRDILRLIWQCIQPDPEKRPDAKQLLCSAFARNYIPTHKLFQDLRFHGAVLPAVQLNGRVRNPMVLIWIRGRGYQAFTLLNCQAGEESTYYGGLIQTINTNKSPTEAKDLSLHTIVVSATEMLNGTPCKQNPLENFIEHSAGGSFFRSSRTSPGVRAPGTHALPQRLASSHRNDVQLANGCTFGRVSMTCRTNLMWGAECSFCYDYTNALGIQCLTEEEEAQTVSPYSEDLPPEVFIILRAQRAKVLQEGYKDSLPTRPPCTIDFCGCAADLIKECDMFMLTEADVNRCLSASPNLGAPKGASEFWVMPDRISEADLKRITVSDFFFNHTAKQAETVALVQTKVNTESCAYLKGYLLSHPRGRDLMAAALKEMKGTPFDLCVHLNTSKKRIDKGDESKLIAYIQESRHPVAGLLTAVTDVILPGFQVAVSKDARGSKFREVSVLSQTQTKIGPRLQANSIMQSVHQILHVDTIPLNANMGDKKACGVHRPSLQHYVDGEGPVSVWIPLPEKGKTISMVIYLGSSKHAVKLLANCAKHFRMMQQAYLRVQSAATEDEFLRVWIGANVLMMRKEPQSASTEAVSIPCILGDVLLIHGLAAHGGTDELGFRAFTSMSKQVCH